MSGCSMRWPRNSVVVCTLPWQKASMSHMCCSEASLQEPQAARPKTAGSATCYELSVKMARQGWEKLGATGI